MQALKFTSATYGIYEFSGYCRENVEFYAIKGISENFGDKVKRRIDKITPVHTTRMGTAIRHAITKLENQDAHTKIMFLVSDVHDTHMALVEARQRSITPFCPDGGQDGPRLPEEHVRGYGLRGPGRHLCLPRTPARAVPGADGAAVRAALRTRVRL